LEPVVQEPREPPEFLSVGSVVRPHGVHGALVLEANKDTIHSVIPSHSVYLGPEKAHRMVRSIRPHRGRFILCIEGCEDRKAAERWRGAELFISFGDAEPLREHEYYYWQIIGLKVQTEDGQHLGRLEQIIETGVNDVYLVRTETGGELLLPAIESVIRDVDLEGQKIVVHLLPGLLAE
jgi:16S rRNA processing protein RimM